MPPLFGLLPLPDRAFAFTVAATGDGVFAAFADGGWRRAATAHSASMSGDGDWRGAAEPPRPPRPRPPRPRPPRPLLLPPRLLLLAVEAAVPRLLLLAGEPPRPLGILNFFFHSVMGS